ncbi:hypothetical protein [Burkholderia pseudomallei]|nr:hypothetical protein [Burkholderia pseudomallei]AJW53622.1 hypothetical protein UQ47_11530 [Burkholderia pseudomallei]ARK87097.1 hypothetical protein BOC42_06655 [Burkholderia pseudomallei]ARL14878.1 hypothetical protein BOC46_04460 [Burkholderia pseudomallei]MBF3387907.1 hypothetical protein [Burkholderia pseudomallei]MBF3394490.1 hypothetical protein [Burkholderia pseudomallei]
MTMPVDLLVTGSGSLAEAVLFDLVAMPTLAAPMTIVVAARNAQRLAWLAQAAHARACALDTHHRVACRAIDWEAPGDLARLLAEAAPKVVFHAASLQSMWEIARGEDAWAAEIRASGYGATLPLQLALALRVARAIGERAPASRFVNACYPDASNEILARLGHDVTCGIGNVATLAATYAARLGVEAPRRLRMLAHHRQVAAAIAGQGRLHPPRAWIDGAAAIAPDALPDVRLPAGASLNLVTGATGARLIAALLGRVERYAGHAPGPLGLCGGYPVTICGGRLELDLPPGLTLEEAVASNREWAREEGVSIDAHGNVRIASGRAALAADGGAGGEGSESSESSESAALPLSYRIDEIEDVARHLMRVKADLQRRAA